MASLFVVSLLFKIHISRGLCRVGFVCCVNFSLVIMVAIDVVLDCSSIGCYFVEFDGWMDFWGHVAIIWGWILIWQRFWQDRCRSS